MNLAGRTLVLENVDSLGVDSQRAYKNVRFYVSSQLYGLFMYTSAHVRLSVERFPDPEGFMAEMREQGYRFTLWQTPEIGEGNKPLSMAKERR